jgi:hypothetical protein
MGGTWRHPAGSTLSLDPNRPPVRVRGGGGLGIAEDIVDQRHESAKSRD